MKEGLDPSTATGLRELVWVFIYKSEGIQDKSKIPRERRQVVIAQLA
jgi:hypothetical protein